MKNLFAALWFILCSPCLALPARAVELKPPDEGLDNGKGGHWGIKNDKDWVDSRWNNVDVGPFISCALQVPGGNVNKGIAIKVGENPNAAVCFDGARLGISAAWTGAFVQFSGNRFGLIAPPVAKGEIVYSLPQKDLWAGATGRYKGLYLHGQHVTLSYTVNGVDILESPWSEKEGITIAISRSLQIGASTAALDYTIAGGKGMQPDASNGSGQSMCVLESGENCLAACLVGTGATLLSEPNGSLVLHIPPHPQRLTLKVLQWAGMKKDLSAFAALAQHSPAPADLDALCKPGPSRWGAALPTKGTVSTDTKPYVIDTIAIPFKNTYNAMFFCSGLDFLDNGNAVISTLHGDVWIVSGIDAGLQNVTWKRFATGLFQPIGVKVIKNRIYVLGRDQVTILNDTNNDGEADFYENFCNAVKTSSGGHDYSAGLETDSAGNLYHVDPFGLHRISKSGDQYETIAAGWRNPVTLAVGPDDVITVAPQEGNWTPASQICEVKANGWYGFGGPKVSSSCPLGYDPPLCYIPRLVDNSTGGMTWAPASNWGPLSGHMLNLSFGQCSMQMVLREQIDGGTQGGVVPLDLRFQSGAFRGRVRPTDGQMYVVGTQGWATSAAHDGSLQRVRYTGGKLSIPIAVKTCLNGLKLTFSEPLEAASAEDVDSYSVEQWNYHYSAQYGSAEYSVAQPGKTGHDGVELTAAKLDETGKSVLFTIPGLQPVMQLRIKYRIKDKDGAAVRGEIDYTIRSTGDKRVDK